MICIDLSPLKQPNRPVVNTWVEENKDSGRNVLGTNDNINNIIKQQQKQAIKAQPRRDLRASNAENEKNERSSRIKSGTSAFNRTAKERDLTPSRIINNTKNIRLSNQAVVATGDNAALMQIQRVPVNSLLEESKRLTQAIEDAPV